MAIGIEMGISYEVKYFEMLRNEGAQRFRAAFYQLLRNAFTAVKENLSKSSIPDVEPVITPSKLLDKK